MDGAWGDAERKKLNWAGSKTVGRITEIAVMAPVKLGCVPGERRTYEERIRDAIANINTRHAQGLPTELGAVPTIHFGRIMLIRPEQYLVYSKADCIQYVEETIAQDGTGCPIPKPFDEYGDGMSPLNRPTPADGFRTWVLTTVEFDGDLKVYFRDIARLLGRAFDSIFENCEDFPGTASFEKFWQWIRRYQMTTQLFYAPYADLTVARLKQLEVFKSRFDAFVARVRTPTGRRVEDMDELFDAFLRENQQYARNFPTAGGLWTPDGCDEEA
ncbi:hypothetical protein [Phenylobacterium sp.]|jgi:hypothetical protein|uniref:hypothetical protein n=1 Tax=Phenylobacterium sp. TaxID=1871053 RepID=UPI002F956991